MMQQGLISWLLAGALAASLAWNFRPKHSDGPTGTCGMCTASTAGCVAALDTLDLTPEQRRALDAWSRTACGGSSSADRASCELFDSLSVKEFDPERVRALAAEAGKQRAEALRACAESVIEVRRVLTPEQAEKLIGACCAPRTE